MTTLQCTQRLANVQPAGPVAESDGKFMTVQERLKDVIADIERDLKECANACDTYCKKHLFSKVFNGSKWSNILERFRARFVERRKAIICQLSIHTSIGSTT